MLINTTMVSYSQKKKNNNESNGEKFHSYLLFRSFGNEFSFIAVHPKI